MASINASTSGAGGVITTADATGNLNLQTAGTTALTITASQNVGIGTASPSSRLHVSASNGDVARIDGTTRSLFFCPDSSGVMIATGAGQTGVGTYYSAGSDFMYFMTGSTERMRIDSSGRLMLGTTTTSISSSDAKYFDAADGQRLFSARGSTAGREHIIFLNPNGDVGSIDTTSSSTAYNTSSDYRLKENIAPMTGALAKVALLKPVTYTWKVDGSDGEGFIAHELQEVKPDCVTGTKDEVETFIDEDGNEQSRPKYQGVDTSFLVATLTAAIQEQQALITSLTARITALEGA